MTRLRALAATLLCAAAAAAIAYGSSVPLSLAPADDAAIRFSWRAVGEPIEECRTPSAEEQARLPLHMRRPVICERRLSAFRLLVELDGTLRIDERIAPEGAQGDRPAYVLYELRVAPGSHRISVRFAPEAETAAPLALDTQLDLSTREVVLVTHAPGSTQLELRRRAAP